MTGEPLNQDTAPLSVPQQAALRAALDCYIGGNIDVDLDKLREWWPDIREAVRILEAIGWGEATNTRTVPPTPWLAGVADWYLKQVTSTITYQNHCLSRLRAGDHEDFCHAGSSPAETEHELIKAIDNDLDEYAHLREALAKLEIGVDHGTAR